MSEFLKKFNQEYYFNLQQQKWNRSEGWKIAFDLLLSQKKDFYKIIETGILRNWNDWRDGQSTFLFQEFLKEYKGKAFCVDISEEACNISKNYLDADYIEIHCRDSLDFLQTIDLKNVSLYHLDSYDVVWEDPYPSANHHLKEFLIIEPFITSGTVVVIDDNRKIKGRRTGKGLKIYEYLSEKNIHPVYDGYQLIYQL
jgi:hypothetical protein